MQNTPAFIPFQWLQLMLEIAQLRAIYICPPHTPANMTDYLYVMVWLDIKFMPSEQDDGEKERVWKGNWDEDLFKRMPTYCTMHYFFT